MDSFIVYTKHKKLIEKMPDADAGALIKAVFVYAETGEISELPYGADMAFEVIRDVIDTNRDKWQSIKNERSEAGKKGMAKRWNKEDEEDNNVIFDDNKNNTVIKSDNKTYQTITNDNNAITKHNKTDFVNNKNNNVIFDDNKNNLSVSVSVSDSVSVNNIYSSPSDDGGPPDLVSDQEAEKEKEQEQKGERKRRAKENEERFNRFWAAYPKREDKKNAIRVWNKLNVTDQMLDDILTALKKQKASAQWNDRKYIPHPSTWLNGERWKDETEPITSAPPGNNPPEKTQNRKGRHELDPNKNYDFVDEELLALIESMEAGRYQD